MNLKEIANFLEIFGNARPTTCEIYQCQLYLDALFQEFAGNRVKLKGPMLQQWSDQIKHLCFHPHLHDKQVGKRSRLLFAYLSHKFPSSLDFQDLCQQAIEKLEEQQWLWVYQFLEFSAVFLCWSGKDEGEVLESTRVQSYQSRFGLQTAAKVKPKTPLRFSLTIFWTTLVKVNQTLGLAPLKVQSLLYEAVIHLVSQLVLLNTKAQNSILIGNLQGEIDQWLPQTSHPRFMDFYPELYALIFGLIRVDPPFFLKEGRLASYADHLITGSQRCLERLPNLSPAEHQKNREALVAIFQILRALFEYFAPYLKEHLEDYQARFCQLSRHPQMLESPYMLAALAAWSPFVYPADGLVRPIHHDLQMHVFGGYPLTTTSQNASAQTPE